MYPMYDEPVRGSAALGLQPIVSVYVFAGSSLIRRMSVSINRSLRPPNRGVTEGL